MIRFLDIFFSLAGLLLLLPVFFIIAILIKLGSPGPVLYCQERVGRGGVPFTLLKFRSMRVGADQQGLLTVGGRDPRITPIGAFLRDWKLDELPQLWNVLRGDMSLVGPRPEVKKYTDQYTPAQRRVLDVRPGITDYASIHFRQESDILAKSKDPEQTYINEILPEKIRLNSIYLDNQTIKTYFRILTLTLLRLFH